MTEPRIVTGEANIEVKTGMGERSEPDDRMYRVYVEKRLIVSQYVVASSPEEALAMAQRRPDEFFEAVDDNDSPEWSAEDVTDHTNAVLRAMELGHK